MSTYINPSKGMSRSNFSDCPEDVVEYLNYTLTIRGLSARTVNGYYIDLRTFFKILLVLRKLVDEDTPMNQIDISGLDTAFIKTIKKKEIYEYLFFVTQQRENSAAARARKLSSLRGFFKYMTSKTGKLENNPTDDVEMPVQKKRLPKYLSLDESVELLKNIQSDFYERDYCMLMLLLNCGMRLSELVGINTNDIKDDTLRVVGKGNKERLLYLNEACLAAIDDLMAARAKIPNLKDDALFVSQRTKARLSARRVQQIIEACLKAAGLDGKGYSTHKLRHTAATLLYQHGSVDLLSLKEMLGHVDVSTTEIYAHLESAQLKKAADSSPLAHYDGNENNRKNKKSEPTEEI